MNKVVLSKVNKKYHGFDRYEISVHDGGCISPHSEVRRSDLFPIEGHHLIEQYHYDGGGSGGWDTYEEFVGIAHNETELTQKIHTCATNLAKELAEQMEVEFVEKLRHKQKSTR